MKIQTLVERGALLGCSLILLASGLAHAEIFDAALIRDLCSNANSVEGRYHNTTAEPQVSLKNIYFVCAGLDRLSVTFLMGPLQNTAVNLDNIALDGDKLTLTTIKIGSGREIPGRSMPAIRLEISYAALKRGVISGIYRTAMHFRPLAIFAERDQTFPNLVAEADHSRDRLDWDETFVLRRARIGDLTLAFPAYLSVDVIGGLQRITFNDSKDLNFTMYDGMRAEGAGAAFSANSGVSDDLPMLPLLHIRGRIVSPSLVEFYYFNTLYGMLGPFYAERERRP